MYEDIRMPYQASDLPVLQLGEILVNEQLIENAPVNLVLKSFNRHGLIAGATGSGKTKTIQVLVEQLSQAGVPSLVMDIKGDISGLAMPGEMSSSLEARCERLNLIFTPKGYPVEFLTLIASHPGIPLRSTVDDFGSILFSRMLDLNDTQEGVMTVLFEYAKQEKLPLVDLIDIKQLLQFIQTEEGKKAFQTRFGGVATSSVGIIIRKIIGLEAEGGDAFFGEPAYKALDLVKTNAQGEGVVSILRLIDMQDKPKLFSTFMLKLLSDIYKQMPELGDPDKPKLVLFIDEAHLIFSQASKALLTLLDTMVKLIRSKGVGLVFCTQTPTDIPENVLSQLGLKIQHALRAFTAKDRTAMKLVAQNFPPSEHYHTEQLLTSLGIGEALVSGLDGKGQPTPLVQCMIRPPQSRMGILSDAELTTIVSHSTLYPYYSHRQERRSADEMLNESKSSVSSARSKSEESKPSLLTTITKNTLFRQVTRQLMRDVTKMIMSAFSNKKR